MPATWCRLVERHREQEREIKITGGIVYKSKLLQAESCISEWIPTTQGMYSQSSFQGQKDLILQETLLAHQLLCSSSDRRLCHWCLCGVRCWAFLCNAMMRNIIWRGVTSFLVMTNDKWAWFKNVEPPKKNCETNYWEIEKILDLIKQSWQCLQNKIPCSRPHSF